MDLCPADRQPPGERPVELTDELEAAPGDHVLSDDEDLSCDPAFSGGAIGGQHVDGEPVVVSERGRFRMQWDRDPGCDVLADHGLVRS